MSSMGDTFYVFFFTCSKKYLLQRAINMASIELSVKLLRFVLTTYRETLHWHSVAADVAGKHLDNASVVDTGGHISYFNR